MLGIDAEPEPNLLYLYHAPGVKQLMHETYHSSQISVRVKNKWTYTSASLYALVAYTRTTYCRQKLINISIWIRTHRTKQAVHLTWAWTRVVPACPRRPRCWPSSSHSSPAPPSKVWWACLAVRSLCETFPWELQHRLLSGRSPGCFPTVAAVSDLPWGWEYRIHPAERHVVTRVWTFGG